MRDFRYTGRDDIAVLSLPDLELVRVVNANTSPIAYGAALLETTDYLYIYGLEDGAQKHVHLARAHRRPAGRVGLLRRQQLDSRPNAEPAPL